MTKRHDIIGIKQVIRFEWMQRVADLLLGGLDNESIRQELHIFLADKKGNGSKGPRSDLTRAFVVQNLMGVWCPSNSELIPFRDTLLVLLRKNPSMASAIHWAMISAAYPFWFNAARQAGRLLALQNQATQAQIINRIKGQYGDRSTVERYARYVVRSFVAWGVINDSKFKGCYEKVVPIRITDNDLAALMFESALLATPEARGLLSPTFNSPAFFPFVFPMMTGDLISQYNDRVEVTHRGLDGELLGLKNVSV